MRQAVVIVGGGFAGVYAALAATRVLDGDGEVILVSRDTRLGLRPRLFEAEPETLHAELEPILSTAGIKHVLGEVTALDLAERRVHLASGLQLAYSRLVVAVGSVMTWPTIPGIELAHSIDTQDEAIALDRRLAECAGRAEPTIAVLGAGFTGIELALNLRDRLAVHGGQAAADRARIVLVDKSLVVGPELGPGPRPQIEQALADADVELRLDEQVVRILPDAIELRGGERLPSDIVVLCTGLSAAPLVKQVPGETDALGRIKVDAFLRAPLAPDVFVTGDAACAAPEPGRATLMSCQHAMPLGKTAGENAARDLLGQALIPYAQPRYSTCLDLGRSGAVLTSGWERTVQMAGEEAKAVKRQINTRLIYPPSGSREEILKASLVG
jgi:NADH:ubiquinone reductase (H+-translocating)